VRSSRLRQILTPVIEAAIDELEDLPRVRLHLEEDAQGKRTTIKIKGLQLKCHIIFIL
jgi:C4-dicarboxylate-specific signal transduction histidine kinase